MPGVPEHISQGRGEERLRGWEVLRKARLERGLEGNWEPRLPSRGPNPTTSHWELAPVYPRMMQVLFSTRNF